MFIGEGIFGLQRSSSKPNLLQNFKINDLIKKEVVTFDFPRKKLVFGENPAFTLKENSFEFKVYGPGWALSLETLVIGQQTVVSNAEGYLLLIDTGTT